MLAVRTEINSIGITNGVEEDPSPATAEVAMDLNKNDEDEDDVAVIIPPCRDIIMTRVVEVKKFLVDENILVENK